MVSRAWATRSAAYTVRAAEWSTVFSKTFVNHAETLGFDELLGIVRRCGKATWLLPTTPFGLSGNATWPLRTA